MEGGGEGGRDCPAVVLVGFVHGQARVSGFFSYSILYASSYVDLMSYNMPIQTATSFFV